MEQLPISTSVVVTSSSTSAKKVAPPALQHLWARRTTSTTSKHLQGFEEGDLLADADFFLPAQVQDEVSIKSPAAVSPCPNVLSSSEDNSHGWKKHEHGQPPPGPLRHQWLDGSDVGDIPVRYAVASLQSHEMAVIGAFIDPRVVPGFRYRVRTLGEDSRSLFKGRALTLMSIGRGYGRRLTFQPDKGQLNTNGNYFWSDSNPEGYALQLDVVTEGDKFTVHDANHVVAGTLEVLHTQGPQTEVSRDGSLSNRCEKSVRVQALCKLEWFEGGEEMVLPMSGLAVVSSVLKRSLVPSAVRMVHVALGPHHRGYSLTQGVNDNCRRTTVYGERIHDVPTSYTVIGLETHEMPVVGTYVDPRISTGFHYRVRRLGGVPGRWLFGGRPLLLQNVGAGYGKRLTFQPDRLNAPENFFWSDSGHGDGFACEIRAVFASQRFAIVAGGIRLGEAVVFRADSAQSEESSHVLPGGGLLKMVRVEVTCNVSFGEPADTPQTMRVTGTAVLSRGARQPKAKLLRLENVGLNSQLNLLFVRQSASVVFLPF